MKHLDFDFHLVLDQGFGGSISLSPTIQMKRVGLVFSSSENANDASFEAGQNRSVRAAADRSAFSCSNLRRQRLRPPARRVPVDYPNLFRRTPRRLPVQVWLDIDMQAKECSR